jgi:hypothetical protein
VSPIAFALSRGDSGMRWSQNVDSIPPAYAKIVTELLTVSFLSGINGGLQA